LKSTFKTIIKGIIMKKYFYLLLILLFFSCTVKENKDTQHVSPSKKIIKIILIDASGSFFKTFEKTENGKISLFQASVKQIKENHLKPAKAGERVLVHAITEDGFGHKSVICDLNFTSTSFFFSEPKPKGAGRLAIWKRKKKKFNKEIEKKIDSIKAIEIKKFDQFVKDYSKMGGTQKTDLCGTLANIPYDIKHSDSLYNDSLYIYSDLRNNTNLSRCEGIDCTNLNVIALYINEDGFDPKKYKKFREEVIEKYFKNAKSIKLFNPTNSKGR